MRLPQSSSQPLSIRFVSIVSLLTLAATLPLYGRQATGHLTSSPQNLRYGQVTVGQAETEQAVLTNTGDASLTISAISASASQFGVSGVNLPVSLDAGQSVTIDVTFTPTADGLIDQYITVSSNAQNPSLQIDVAGIGVKSQPLTPSPSSLSFGPVAVGQSATSLVTVTNSQNSSVTVMAFQMDGASFSVSGPPVPVTLATGQSITLNISFTPKAIGADAGGVLLSGPGLKIPLNGTGAVIGQLTISPTALSFGSVNIGVTTTQPASLTATGGAVTISSISSSNSQFSLAGVSLPLTVNANQTVGFDVVFDPTVAGADTGSLTFSGNSNTISEPLGGTGVQPTYSVNLSWNASSSVVGYNVYRGIMPGTYSKINSALDPNTAYTDSTVVAGTTYYYAATSVNSSGQESTYSPPVEIAVP